LGASSAVPAGVLADNTRLPVASSTAPLVDERGSMRPCRWCPFCIIQLTVVVRVTKSCQVVAASNVVLVPGKLFGLDLAHAPQSYLAVTCERQGVPHCDDAVSAQQRDILTIWPDKRDAVVPCMTVLCPVRTSRTRDVLFRV
jgi:hypothetical protein